MMNLNKILKIIPDKIGIFFSRSENNEHIGKWVCSIHTHEGSPFDYRTDYHDSLEDAAKELVLYYEKLIPKIDNGDYIPDIFQGNTISLYFDDINHLWKATLDGYYNNPGLELSAMGKTKVESIKNLFLIYIDSGVK